VVAGPVVAIVTVLTALLATRAAGVPFRDPDHMVGRRLVWVGCLVVLLVGLDVVVRAGRRSGTLTPSRTAMRSVRRERWSWYRGVAVGSALVSFYVSYLAYRNLKSIVPLLRPGELFDRQLADFDRGLFGGNDPAALLHSLLGTGVQTQVLSVVYVALIFFVPISLALALVFSRARRAASSTSSPCRSTGGWAPRATSCSPPWDRSTPRRPASPTCPLRRLLTCKAFCSTSGSSSLATRRPRTRIRASRPSAPCTPRSSSQPRLQRICWG